MQTRAFDSVLCLYSIPSGRIVGILQMYGCSGESDMAHRCHVFSSFCFIIENVELSLFVAVTPFSASLHPSIRRSLLAQLCCKLPRLNISISSVTCLRQSQWSCRSCESKKSVGIPRGVSAPPGPGGMVRSSHSILSRPGSDRPMLSEDGGEEESQKDRSDVSMGE